MTETSKHTAGPWTFEGPDQFGDFNIQQEGQTSAIGAVVSNLRHPHQVEANARLIAAAPELLSIAQRWAALDGGARHVVRHAREKKELLADTRAALSAGAAQ